MFQDHDDLSGLPWLMAITLIMTAYFGLPIGRGMFRIMTSGPDCIGYHVTGSRFPTAGSGSFRR